MPEIIEAVSLKKNNTFNIDVKARWFASFNSEEELFELLKTDLVINEKLMILGGGSNILFTEDFDGVVLKNEIGGIEINSEKDNTIKVTVGAGVVWDDFVKWSVDKNLWGIENLAAIPGTVGAAPIQNIGAYGVELQDVIDKVEFIVLETGKRKILNNSECRFGYRDSIFKSELKGKIVITRVSFLLSKLPDIKAKYGTIKNELEHRKISNPGPQDMYEIICNIREQKLPDIKINGNAGSFFKNPVISRKELREIETEYPDVVHYELNNNDVKIPAGWLIEKCGFKGKKVGSVATFKNQALVIINCGDASGGEILNYSIEVQNEVFNKFNIKLTPEVNIV